MTLWARLKSKIAKRSVGEIKRDAGCTVAATAKGVSCARSGGKVESVTWDDLRIVAIQTTNEGPFSTDIFWILTGKEGGCIIPMGATGEDAFLERLQQLEGFDNEAVIRAMSCAENQTFICWRNATDYDSRSLHKSWSAFAMVHRHARSVPILMESNGHTDSIESSVRDGYNPNEERWPITF